MLPPLLGNCLPACHTQQEGVHPTTPSHNPCRIPEVLPGHAGVAPEMLGQCVLAAPGLGCLVGQWSPLSHGADAAFHPLKRLHAAYYVLLGSFCQTHWEQCVTALRALL